MQFTKDNLDRLLEMKPGESAVWTAAKTPVFKTRNGYFGHYLAGDPEDPWTVDCISGTSPTVFRPKRMEYACRFDMGDGGSGAGTDRLFVFSTQENCICLGWRVMPWYNEWRIPSLGVKNVSGGIFRRILNENSLLYFDKTFFSENECAEKCRELNRNYCDGDAVGSLGKWYEKTLDDMQRQLRECLSADYVVDPAEKLKKIVENPREED